MADVTATVRRALDRLSPRRSSARPRAEPPEGPEGLRQRRHADREDDVVVFLIGMRINAFWKLHRWLPVLLVAPRLVRRLRDESDSELLGSWTFVSPPRTIGFVQYWDSFASLETYASDADRGHLEARGEYNEQAEEGAVGIWHETYRVAAHETVYNNVPPRGLGADGSELVNATGRLDSAGGRIRASASRDECASGDETDTGPRDGDPPIAD